MSGTWCLTQIARSASKRGLVWCTIRLTPKGAAFLPVSASKAAKAALISMIQDSKPSVLRWLSAGKVPTIPCLQHSMTN